MLSNWVKKPGGKHWGQCVILRSLYLVLLTCSVVCFLEESKKSYSLTLVCVCHNHLSLTSAGREVLPPLLYRWRNSDLEVTPPKWPDRSWCTLDFPPGPLALSTWLVTVILSLPLYYRNKHDLVLEFLPSVSSVSLATSCPLLLSDFQRPDAKENDFSS